MKPKKYLTLLVSFIFIFIFSNITVFAEYDTIDLSTHNSGYSEYNVVYNGYTYERKITYTNVNIPIGKTVIIEFEDLDEYNYYDGTISYIDTTYFNIVSNKYKKIITITPIKAGTTHIDCEYNKYTGLGNVYAKCVARADITIIDDLEIALTATSKTMNVNKTKYLQASVSPYELYINNISTYGNLKWTSSNATCVSISCGNAKGIENVDGENTETLYTTITSGAITLTSKVPGTAIITCELAKDNSVKATCVITVVDNRVAVSDVTLNSNSISLTTSENETLIATVKPLNATNQNVTWKSSNTDVVIVSNGKLYPQTEGTATVTVTTDDGGYKSTCIVNVSNPWNIIIKPTKSETGIAEKNIGLGRKTTKVLPSLTDSSFWKITEQVDATCKTDGYVWYSSECGTIKVNIPPNDNHNWSKRSETDLGNGEVSSYYVCTNCNKTKTETEPAFLYALNSDKTIQIYGFKYGNNLKGEIRFPSMINSYLVKTVNLDLWCTDFDLSNVTGIVFEDGITEVGDGFSALENLTYVKLPNTLETINACAFKDCSKITSIEIPGTVHYIGEEAFSGCVALENVIINEGVEEIGVGAFSKCPIENLVIPTTIKSLGDFCFSSAKITEISLPEGLTVLGNVFSNIEYYYIPSTITSITGLYSFGDGVCKGIYVSKDNSNYSSDEYGVLYNKDKTELLVYPGAIEEKTYVIPDNVEKIGRIAFGNTERENLETLSLPASLKTVSNSALWMCTNINKIIFRGTKEAFSNIEIESNNKILETAEIVYETDITDISLDNTNLSMSVNESISLNVTITPDYVKNVKWSTSDENIVSVSEGIITAISVGTATITVSNDNGSVFATCIVNVKEEQRETVSAPQANISTEWVKKGTKLSLKTLTEEAYIYYTMDESDPIENGLLYTEEIQIDESVTIKAIAIKENMINSDVAIYIYSVIENDSYTWDLDEKGILTISGIGNMTDYPTVSTVPWYSERINIKQIVISDGITSIGTKAFYGCINATLIEIPESVIAISENAFKNCDEIQISGINGSYAQKYAIANNIPFISSSIVEPLPDLNVSFSETSARWYFDISNETYIENAVIHIGIYDENNKLITAVSENMVNDDITSISVAKVNNYSYAKVFEWVDMQPVANLKNILLNQ